MIFDMVADEVVEEAALVLADDENAEKLSSGADESVKNDSGDIQEIEMEKCVVVSASTDVNPITIVSQDDESVTFTVSQSWKGCDGGGGASAGVVSWLATDYIAVNGDLECSTSDNVRCGVVNTYTAQCEDGFSIVDLYAYDKEGELFQSHNEKVFVPLACGSSGHIKKMCHFRYMLKCSGDHKEHVDGVNVRKLRG